MITAAITRTRESTIMKNLGNMNSIVSFLFIQDAVRPQIVFALFNEKYLAHEINFSSFPFFNALSSYVANKEKVIGNIIYSDFWIHRIAARSKGKCLSCKKF